MRYLAVILLCSCAFHPNLNTSSWATTGDLVIAGKADCHTMEQFDALNALQKSIGVTNLTLRHEIIEGVCKHDTARIESARMSAKRLIRDGYWVENFSYALYVQSAFLWAGLHDLDTVIAKYARLVAPNGEVPIPETRQVYLPIPSVVSNNLDFFYMDSTYLVRQWRGGWVLICIGTHPGPKYNLHAHADFGAYSYWRDGRWVHRIAPYTGFSLTRSEGDGLGLSWDVSAWRFSDKPRSVLYANKDSVGLTYGNQVERFYFNDSLEVK